MYFVILRDLARAAGLKQVNRKERKMKQSRRRKEQTWTAVAPGFSVGGTEGGAPESSEAELVGGAEVGGGAGEEEEDFLSERALTKRSPSALFSC